MSPRQLRLHASTAERLSRSLLRREAVMPTHSRFGAKHIHACKGPLTLSLPGFIRWHQLLR